MPPTPEASILPADLLHAVAERQGRVVLIVGAGCSIEPPTGLKLAGEYAMDVHRELVLDGVLAAGDCENPQDLSRVASAVWDRHGSQAAVVERLPRAEFRTARANDGYLIAAALLREGAVSCVLTLNFDLAMSSALTELSASDVEVIVGPQHLAYLGSATVIYLHRNVDEDDPDKWILRREALDEEWRDDWQEVVARRVMAAPVTVFARLGSPAAVLTETVTRIRAVVSDVVRTYVVDPAAETAFQAELNLTPESHLQLGWVEFMRMLGARVAAEHCAALEAAALALCAEHGWDGESEHASSLCARFTALGLVLAGKMKALWLLERQGYAPDDARRGLIADILLAVGLIERELGATAHFREDGVVEFRKDATIVASVLVASGGGTRRWMALEPRVRAVVGGLRSESRPEWAILGGVQGSAPEQVAPPEDLISGDAGHDIVAGEFVVDMVMIDELRNDPTKISEIAV
jgi:hypothetical protein